MTALCTLLTEYGEPLSLTLTPETGQGNNTVRFVFLSLLEFGGWGKKGDTPYLT